MKVILAIVLVLFSINLYPQHEGIDISLTQDNNLVKLYLSPSELINNNILSSLLFTLKWESKNEISLETSYFNYPYDYQSIHKVGPVYEFGNYKYQIYSSFGFSPLYDINRYPLEINITTCGEGDIYLSYDYFISSINGDYFISINGIDETNLIVDYNTKEEIKSNTIIEYDIITNQFRIIYTNFQTGEISYYNFLGQKL